MSRRSIRYLKRDNRYTVPRDFEKRFIVLANLMYQMSDAVSQIEGNDYRIVIKTSWREWSHGNDRGVIFHIEIEHDETTYLYTVAIDVKNDPMDFLTRWVVTTDRVAWSRYQQSLWH